MILDYQTVRRLRACVSRDKRRPVLNAARVCVSEGYAEATDGRVLVRIAVEGAVEGAKDVLVSGEALRMVRRGGWVEIQDGAVRVALPGGGHAVPQAVDGGYPNTEGIYRDPSHEAVKIRLSPETLKALAAQENAVTLYLPVAAGEVRQSVCWDIDGADGGVLMPAH